VSAAPPPPDPFAVNEQAMIRAITNKNLSQVTVLSHDPYYQPNVTWGNNSEDSYISQVIFTGCNSAILSQLLTTGADPNAAPQYHGEPVLYWSMDICPALVQPMLQAHADPNISFCWGNWCGPVIADYGFVETPAEIHMCSDQYTTQVKEFMQVGADANGVLHDRHGGISKESVLWAYLTDGEVCTDQISILIDKSFAHPADVNWQMAHGTKPIDYVAQCVPPPKRQPVMQILISNGSPPARPTPVNCNNPQSW